MIDLHGHYLPAVDDGAIDLETSLSMLRLAEADGIEAVVATPHACSALCSYKEFDTLRRNWEKWRKAMENCEFTVKVYAGAEIYFTSELLALLKEHHNLLTINNSSYFLLEFPADYIYAHCREFIYKILIEGFIPIISHAERNRGIQRSPAVLRELVKEGALCQVNAGSLRGGFGDDARQSAYELIQSNLVHVIASDAHNLESRSPELSYVPALLHGVDPERVNLYLHGIPEAIIADEAVPDIGEPVQRFPRRSFFDFLKKRES
jgi:protein-tyrosine phosphatase